MTSGGICAVVLSLLVSLKNARRVRFKSQLQLDAFHSLQSDLLGYARGKGWRGEDASRLGLVIEECFMFLCNQDDTDKALTVFIRGGSEDLEVEWVTASAGENAEALLLTLDLDTATHAEDDLRLKILQSMTDGLVHQQFRDTEFLKVHLTKKANLPRALGA